jgi:hypothetical protein
MEVIRVHGLPAPLSPAASPRRPSSGGLLDEVLVCTPPPLRSAVPYPARTSGLPVAGRRPGAGHLGRPHQRVPVQSAVQCLFGAVGVGLVAGRTVPLPSLFASAHVQPVSPVAFLLAHAVQDGYSTVCPPAYVCPTVACDSQLVRSLPCTKQQEEGKRLLPIQLNKMS